MKYLSTLLLVLLLTSYSSALRAEKNLQLSYLVKEVKTALLTVMQQTESLSSMPKLHSVELELKTTHTLMTNGNVGLYVLSLDSNVSSENASKINLLLTPPRANETAPVSSASLSNKLAKTILAAAKAIKIASDGPPKLYAQKLDIEIIFAITSDAQGGFKLDFPPFNVSASGGKKKIVTQKLLVKYKT